MSRLYDLRRWRRESRAFLRANPLCVMCKALGKTTLATVVDHKTPHRDDEALFWDQDNWQALCATDHSAAKQAEEKGGGVRGCDALGRPLDPSHPWRQ